MKGAFSPREIELAGYGSRASSREPSSHFKDLVKTPHRSRSATATVANASPREEKKEREKSAMRGWRGIHYDVGQPSAKDGKREKEEWEEEDGDGVGRPVKN